MSDEELRFTQVTKILKDAIVSPLNRGMEKFITWALTSFVNEKNLSEAIDQDLDVLTLALNHYGLSHSNVTPLFRTSLKMCWSEAEAYLTDVEKVFSLLSKNPRCAKILDTERGRSYLNRCCRSAYEQLYFFVWEDTSQKH